MIEERHRLLLERERVDLSKVSQVELWTHTLDIYTADLFNAVAAVGNSSDAVLRYILERGLAGRARRAAD